MHETPSNENPNANNLQFHDDFFEQMLSSLPSSWPDLDQSPNNFTTAAPSSFDDSSLLASRLRQHHLTAVAPPSDKSLPGMFHLNSNLLNGSNLMPLPLSLASADASNTGVDGNGIFSGFTAANQQQQFHQSQTQSFPAVTTPSAGGGSTAAPPRQRVRARRGQATDPHSIAERLRRERIAERMKALQELVPNANKTDKASMLDEIIDYVKFLQLQVKVLSMSRLGGAAAVAPLVADISSENRNSANGILPSASNDALTVTEHQVAKLMEEDMGSAMQYLQGKGLCLMPISLASAISTVTCHPRVSTGLVQNHNGDSPSSPNLSVLTVQSVVGAGHDGTKDATSVSKP